MSEPQVFRGRTLDEARRAAQVALGDGAVIVRTREVRRPALLGLVAKSSFEAYALPPEPPKPPPPVQRSGVFATSAYQSPKDLRDDASLLGEELASLRAELRREIRGVRQSLSAQNTGRESSMLEAELEYVRASIEALREDSGGRRDPVGSLLRERGIEGLAAAMIGRALRGRKLSGDALREGVRVAVGELVPVATWPLAREGKRVIALVGPTGVGKTTTAAKLAARAMLDEGKSVTLVACDAFRVGAVDHLRRYASLLRVKLLIAQTRRELETILRDATTDLVIVDTGGRAPDLEGPEGWLAARPRRARQAQMASEVAPGAGYVVTDGGLRDVDVLLCLPASTRARDVTRIAKIFAPLHPTAIAVTKLDETDAPAAIVHGPTTTRLPVSIVTFGQRVPEDIAQATSDDLLDALLPSPRTQRAAEG
jgi:flagellar biosynthesis protein FlhF